MENKLIIYNTVFTNEDGSKEDRVAIIVPSPKCGLTLEQIAKKDALLAEAVRVILADIRSTDFETFDQTLFANPDMTAENVNLGNTRKILEKGTDEINDAVSKAIEQSKELFTNRF